MLSRVIAKNIGDVFFETHCSYLFPRSAGLLRRADSELAGQLILSELCKFYGRYNKNILAHFLLGHIIGILKMLTTF